ncbi:tumor necrosis factor ligand superfamily member 14-like [Thunnus albacares]|uniref:tumor necrosis factor ligand superfamily member 14-like n=1 Tax=Thunnus albacares TaxID=8236 RepID=UPI001CF6B3D1|nr:tumor necrosis factor ligand superfamily member 14-like [Thunnus albacares]
MAEDGYPSVNSMDSHATCPPVPPRLSQGQQCARVGQKALFILVSVALCGMIVEACLIHRLYQTESVTSASVSKIIAEQDDATAAKLHCPVISPSKPVAHLTDGQDAVHAKDIMAWSTDADPLLYEIDYKDRSLVIQKEGYYYVYSKVSFTDNYAFHHLVELRTEKYTWKSINLLKSRKYSNNFKHPEQSNSYLGGVFHLSKGDAIFVKVSNTSKIVQQKPSDNVFGAYMI